MEKGKKEREEEDASAEVSVPESGRLSAKASASGIGSCFSHSSSSGMLAARGVSLGLGKINLSELNQLPAADRALLGRIQRLKRKAREQKPKLVIRKHVDKKTLWLACRVVGFGLCVITMGFFFAAIGYFEPDFTTNTVFNETTGQQTIVVDAPLRFKLRAFQYIGPVLMGFGTFLLIIACVVTLESRDSHAQIIQEEPGGTHRAEVPISATKTSLLPNEEIEMKLNGALDVEDLLQRTKSNGSEDETAGSWREDIAVEIHNQPGTPPRRPDRLAVVGIRTPRGPAPIASVDSVLELPLSTSGSAASWRDED